MTVDTLVSHLTEWSEGLNDLEKQATKELYDNNNETAYRDLMRRRAELLRSLPERATGLPQPLRAAADFPSVLETLRGFAQNADNALRLDSIFYMSALLYPDEHTPGEPNNLELLIRELTR